MPQSKGAAKKKKITRLVPAEESLEAIEECTERSEDSSIISENDMLISPRMKSRNGMSEMAKTPIAESSVGELDLSGDDTGSGGDVGEELVGNHGSENNKPLHSSSASKSHSSSGRRSNGKKRHSDGHKHHHGSSSKEHSVQALSSQSQAPPDAIKNLSNGAGSPSEDAVTTVKATEVGDEDDDSLPGPEQSRKDETTAALHMSNSSLGNSGTLSYDAGMLNDSGLHHSHPSQGEDGMFDFDDDFDDEIGEPEKEEALTWRLDPSQSLSDWTIIIKTREEEKRDTYHVHKNILAVGPRRSEYFVNVFRMHQGANESTTTTEVELGSAAAMVFPDFLDFMYSTEGNLHVETANATGLRHLAQFFGIRLLHKKVMDFILKDLSLTTVTVYYNDVMELRDEKLLVNLAKYCAKNVMRIDKEFPLFQLMDPFFFSRIMDSRYINSKEKKYHVSQLLAEYCIINRGLLVEKQFSMLTEEKRLPLVHYSAAFTLMEMEVDIVSGTVMASLTDVSSLQKRCVRDLAYHWKELVEMDPEDMTRVCRKLQSSVVTELLIKTLANAKRKMASLEGDSSHSSKKGQKQTPGERPSKKGAPDPHREAKKELEAKLERLKYEHQEEITQMKKEYEQNLVRLRDLLLEKDKTISKFWTELKNFERLPNSLEGKLVGSGRLHEATYLPEHRKTSADGYLYVSKAKGGPKFPVFYYHKRDDRGGSESASGGR